ncbi:type I polyketide synthase [Actinomadura rupiterrae]|uniref:type I polyketide synthase n=1 Tax=Actinomadura rupiterrae TaxID=559627 RepID=UPI0020A61BDD|nr:type I polyketide synthase [Actinomadura rupiterrae]MCP2336079.1 6-methylsalicylic acid synthase [Actinomadura rupiterrae]
MTQDSESAGAVAVIGMSCRFAPDLDSPDRLWEFLREGRSSVRPMPAKRWDPYAAGSPRATAIMRGTTRLGSFLDDIEGFDAEFFGITPREADFLDPQQRIMLELAWEALAAAGVPPLDLRGTETGVFVAANSNDYGRRLLEDIPRTGAYAVNGTTYYGIANRISYSLDLRGPSVAVDTACAGSLTALHHACQELRLGGTGLAIVGGVNVMSTPALFVALDAAGATSPDGRSKAFDAAADGYGRGEGAGVVVLKRLEDARRDGDPVLAVIMGSGVFQDGRSDGMMAPNNEAQEHMLRQVYRRAGIDPASVDYVEAHGTGTPTGDREEALALGAVFGADRPAGKPCLIGSVKPNIGHIEGGSGIAGLIKVVLALRNGEIPPSVHTEPHPGIDWDATGLRLVGEPLPWPDAPGPRRAGVSSYGVGGTIAHLVVQEAPTAPAPPKKARRPKRGTAAAPLVFPVSAMSEKGLRGIAAATADRLGEEHPPLASIGRTLAVHRSHLAWRAAVVASTEDELVERLRTVADGEEAPGVLRGRTASGASTGPVWVFSGHGAQWSGMGRELLRDEPVFAAALDDLAEVFREEMGWTPREALEEGGPWTAAHVQALTFAMQIGLAEVWRARGVAPAAVIGHSVGEIAAAVVAGTLDRHEAARFACRRATALRRIEGRGGMALVGLTADEVRERLGDRTDVVAAIDAAPASTVISGDHDPVAELAETWKAEGIPVWKVDSDIAFHSPHVLDVLDEVAHAAGQMLPRPAEIPLYSTTLADPRGPDERDAGYWADNLRRPVRFTQAVAAAVEDGHTLFLEISSHPVVAHSITETLDDLGVEDGASVPSLRRDKPERETLARALADLHCRGGAIDWTKAQPGGALIDLPATAWQHRPYWIFPEEAGGDAGSGTGHDPDSHLLLGGRSTVSGAPVRQVWQTHLDLTCRPYPQSHEVVGVEITPAACLIDTFATAAAIGGVPGSLSDIVLRTPVAVTPPRTLQIVLSENSVRLATRLAHEGPAHEDEQHEWITHCTGMLDTDVPAPSGRLDVDAVRARCTEPMTWEAVDAMFRTMGVGGYAFPWDPTELRRNGREQLAVLTIEPDADRARSWAHVIDGALTLSAVVVTPEDARRLWMSCHIDSVAFRGEPPARITVHSARSARSPQDTVDVRVAGEDGEVVLEVLGLKFAALQDEFGVVAAPRDLVHEIAWRPLEPENAGPAVTSVLLVGEGDRADRVAGQIARSGVRTRRVASADELRPEDLPGSDVLLVVPDVTGAPPEDEAEGTAWSLVRSAQRLSASYAAAREGDGPLPRLWCLSEGVRDAAGERALAQAPLWGVSRIIAGEHPELWGGLLDVPALTDTTGADLLEVMSAAPGTEDVLALAADGVEVPRLVRIERPADGAPQPCTPAGTYLVTGGLGALGLAVAQWLVDRGARRLLLAGRRGLPPREEWDAVTDVRTRRGIDAVLALEAQGATVRVPKLDITDAEQVATALDPATHGLPPIRGIVHAAGVVMDAMVDKVDRNGLREVLGPKAGGAMVLHRLFPPGSLDFFVFFSSCGQFARLTGQTSYAASNSFLDALAAHRRAGGEKDTVSLGWTSWRGMGMSETLTGTLREANSRGLDVVSADEAFRSWSFADRFDGHYKAVVRVLPLPRGARRVPMFRDITAVDAAGADGGAGFTLDWETLDEAAVLERLGTDVREQVAAELNLAVEDVEPRRPLVEFGVDSVMTVALRVRLQLRYGVDLPPNILWNKPSVAALTEHLAEELRPEGGGEHGDGADDEAGGEAAEQAGTAA